MHEKASIELAAASPEAGFTLAEALVAIVILVVGLMAVTNLMVVGASSNIAANQGTAAATAASEALEALKSQPFCNPPAPPPAVCVPNPALSAGGDLEADDPGPPARFSQVDLPGVGGIRTRWAITAVDAQTRFIRVRSEAVTGIGGARTRAEFTTFRTCTAVGAGCP
jgi:type II secretory pathway pseudopilin PulG